MGRQSSKLVEHPQNSSLPNSIEMVTPTLRACNTKFFLGEGAPKFLGSLSTFASRHFPPISVTKAVLVAPSEMLHVSFQGRKSVMLIGGGGGGRQQSG